PWPWYPLAFDSSLGRDSVVIAFSANRPRDLEQLLENAQQRRRADRLAQELGRSGRPCPPLLVVAGPAGEEYDRDSHAAPGEATLDLQAVHVRHADVQHEACGSRRGSRGQKVFPGGERLGAISKGPDQTAGRLPNRSVIVDDGDERRFIGRWLALPLAIRPGYRHGRNVAARGAIF